MFFSAAIRTGDERFRSTDCIPPWEFYGEWACRVYLRDFVVPDSQFVYPLGRRAGRVHVDRRRHGFTLVQDVVNADVTAVSEEGEIDRVIHLGIVEGDLRWFADCGDPVM